MTLTEQLQTLSTWYQDSLKPGYVPTAGSAEAFLLVLRRTVLDAEALEGAVRMLEARQVAPIGASAMLDGMLKGNVVVLGTHRAIVAHGLDALPDRRFGEDGGGAA